MNKPYLVVAVLLAAAAAANAQQSWVWWEGEAPAATNFPPNHYFEPANDTEAAVLSGGRWIGVSAPREQDLFLEYRIEVPKAGDYNLYARKFWQHGPFRWRFDQQPWQQVTKNIALLDESHMRQFVGANWVHVGPVSLAKGPAVLRIELTERDGAAAFDAFLLTSDPFVARGKLKPDEKYGRAPEGWFAFEPDVDGFAEAMLDLRTLNEPKAGDGGFIESKDGQFVHGKTGQPVRFWAVNAGPNIVSMDQASARYLARSLAKRGVNLVRLHGGVYRNSGPQAGEIDREYLAKVQFFVAALKEQGIYSTLSIYFPLWLDLSQSPRFPGYGADQKPFALPYFHPDFQAMYREWWRAVMTTPNPHTGLPLGQDPAVASIELVNEDSYFFWTFTPYKNVPAPQIHVLEEQFGKWLTQRHGSIDKALASWGGEAVQGDDAAAGRVGLLSAGDLYFRRDQKRAQEAAQFLAESQATFHRQAIAFLRDELGFAASIYASNWITANDEVLGPIDKHTNAVADYMDRHGYYGGPHETPRGYQLSTGDKYDDRTALRFEPGDNPDDRSRHDFGLPLADIVYDGKPSTITEIDWPMPNRYRTEMPLLVAAYGALQGTDACYFFALGGPSWQNTMNKWPLQVPVVLGQFPATAVMYRQGLIKAAPAVVQADLNIDEMMSLKGAPMTRPVNLDDLRAADIPPGQTAAVPSGTVDPRAFYVGQVAMNFTKEPSQLRLGDLSKYIDEQAKVIRSATGELTWDYQRGLVTVDAPAAQGATGFLAQAGPIRTGALTIESSMEYGAILAVSLDGRPLNESQRILLQVMSENQSYGWDAPGEGVREIKSLGDAPIVVRNLAGTVGLTRGDAGSLRVTALDANGYKVKEVGSAERITLEPSTAYYLITR